MSVKVSSWVWHDDATAAINGNEMILLLALADVADDFGRCRYLPEDDALTYDALARKVRVDRRTIERLIPKLRSRGLLSQTKGAKGRPNEFEILVPWAKKSADKVSGNGSDSPTAATDSPTAGTTFPDNGGSHPSIDVLDVVDVYTPTFDDFWSVWPKKQSKKDAERAWARAIKKTPAQVIFDAANAYASSPHRPSLQYVPYGASWLNGERWTDPLPGPGSAGTFAQQKQTNMLDLVGRIQEEERHAQVGSREAAGVLSLDRGA